MRLFAAVLPPAPVADELAAEMARLTSLPDAGRLRWTGRDGWHFTLAFYGTVTDAVLPDLHERLARAARRHPRTGCGSRAAAGSPTACCGRAPRGTWPSCGNWRTRRPRRAAGPV